MRITSTIKRKGKIVGRSFAVVEDGNAADAIREVVAEASRQAKAKDVASHIGRKTYRKKQKA